MSKDDNLINETQKGPKIISKCTEYKLVTENFDPYKIPPNFDIAHNYRVFFQKKYFFSKRKPTPSEYFPRETKLTFVK